MGTGTAHPGPLGQRHSCASGPFATSQHKKSVQTGPGAMLGWVRTVPPHGPAQSTPTNRGAQPENNRMTGNLCSKVLRDGAAKIHSGTKYLCLDHFGHNVPCMDINGTDCHDLHSVSSTQVPKEQGNQGVQPSNLPKDRNNGHRDDALICPPLGDPRPGREAQASSRSGRDDANLLFVIILQGILITFLQTCKGNTDL